MLGIGIGGNPEKAMELAKATLTEPLDMHDLVKRGARKALVQFNRNKAGAAPQLAVYYAANAAFQTAVTLLASRDRLPRLNWPFWIRRDNSMPAMVIAAVRIRLKPSIGPIRSFTPRWSCSIELFKYFDDRSFVSGAR